MFIRKNNIIYNLDHYAKVYPHKDSKTLCLANVQGDFDEIKFETAEEAMNAFNIITNHFIPPVGITPDQIPDMINFDDLGRSFRVDAEGNLRTELNEEEFDSIFRNVQRDQREREDRPDPERMNHGWDDPLANNDWEEGEQPEMPTEPPEEMEGEDVMADPINFATLDAQIEPHVEFSPEMEDAVRRTVQDRFEDQNIINNHLQNQIHENNQFVEEQVEALRDRNDELENRLREMQDLIYNRLLQRDEENVETIM